MSTSTSTSTAKDGPYQSTTAASAASTPSTSPSIFWPKLSPSLQAILSSTDIAIDSLSRIPPSRLQQTALPNIGTIELVSATDFTRYYDELYTTMFPRRAERERSDLIVERLAAQDRGERAGLAPYRIVGIRDSTSGEAIGAAHFSVLPVPKDNRDRQRQRQRQPKARLNGCQSALGRQSHSQISHIVDPSSTASASHTSNRSSNSNSSSNIHRAYLGLDSEHGHEHQQEHDTERVHQTRTERGTGTKHDQEHKTGSETQTQTQTETKLGAGMELEQQIPTSTLISNSPSPSPSTTTGHTTEHTTTSSNTNTDFNFAIPYLQYIYVRPQNRRQDISEVLHTMVLAVSSADAAAMGDGRRRTVPFTLFETEPPDHGDDTASRAYARERSKIHTSTGGLALMLKSKSKLKSKSISMSSADSSRQNELENNNTSSSSNPNPNPDTDILSAHVQPGLEEGDPPLTLVWVIRPSPNPGTPYEVNDIGRELIAAYYQSLRDEGFPEQNISLAESIVEARCRDSVFHLMPLSDVPDLRDQVYKDTRTAG